MLLFFEKKDAIMVALPSFNTLDFTQIVEKLDALIERHLSHIDRHFSTLSSPNWDNTVYFLESLENELGQFWSPISHLHAVCNTPLLRDVYAQSLPKLTAYQSTISQDSRIYNALKSIPMASLPPHRQHILKHQLQQFELSGVNLPQDKKKALENIHTKLSELSHHFENNVLDTTDAFQHLITDLNELSGIQPHMIESFKEKATKNNQTGYLITLDFPSYLAIITYADNRSLRQLMYESYVSRGSCLSPHAPQFDNLDIMNEILRNRYEEATLLSFEDYCALSLSVKMASNTETVLTFLNNLLSKVKATAQNEMNALVEFAKNLGFTDELLPHDVAYYSEKMRQSLYAISDDMLRPYFQTPKVMDGLFKLIETLFNVTFKPIETTQLWHPDAVAYALMSNNEEKGYLLVDLYARPQKRGGAWMDSYQSRRRDSEGRIQLPIAYLTCNFTPPLQGEVGLLTHDEVQTLFHEMGHCLHHLLTTVDELSASGIAGVEWDAVELPSQFLENFTWNYTVIQSISAHIDTKAPLPHELFDKLIRAKNFQSAMAFMRQLEFSLFDIYIHKKPDGTSTFIHDTLNKIRQDTALLPPSPHNRFENSFTHIFAGGYAAGYYSYKWAEVLSADAFARFEEEGVLNPAVGQAFLNTILAVGGSQPALSAFIAFRGRKPSDDALLRDQGIINHA
jgi:oligopeptidase A